MKQIKPHKIIRSKRKTIALQITGDATLIVRAPILATMDYIENVINKKRDWITKKQKEIAKRSEKFAKKEFVNGEGFLYLGETYKLKFVKLQENEVVFDKKFYLSEKNKSESKKILENWYEKEAFRKITQRVEFFAKKSGFKYKEIKLSNATTRWGSCSIDGNLNFTWRIIMAPLRVIDYVVVHELAHLRHRNHSSKFWTTVKTILPNYEKEKEWLKNNGHLLKI